MTTTTAATSQPTMGVIHAFFSCLQVSPYVWMSTPVSRPLIEVLPGGRTRASATAKRRPQTANGFMSRAPLLRPGVFVLGEVAGSDGGLPARLVALVPLRRGVKARGGIVFPGSGVGLALVLALLVDDHLLALAAGRNAERDKERGASEDGPAGRRHDFALAGAAFRSGLP